MKARVRLKVKAPAKRTGFAGGAADEWKLEVAAPPVNGKANDAIIRFLAKLLDVPSSAIRIVTGTISSRKLIEVAGIDPPTVARVILEAHGPRPHSGNTAPRKA